MQITITARHFELTKAIRDHVQGACEKLDRYFETPMNISFILSIENSRSRAEMTFHSSHFNLVADTEEMDMYLAIDNTIEKMESQIKKLKDKITDHQKKTGLKDASEYVYANLFHKVDKKTPKKMIKTKRIRAEVLSIDEALDKLADSGEDYLIFKNEETDRVNVLVCKDNEHFKLIEP